jgi:hypothetical protein
MEAAAAAATATASTSASMCAIASISASVSARNTAANEREQQRELHEVKPVELRAHGLDDAISPREHARPHTTTIATTTTSSSSTIDTTIAVVVVSPECSVLGVRVGCDGSGAALVRALELHVVCQQGHVHVYAHARHYPPPLAHESTHQHHIIAWKYAVNQICLKNSHDTARGIAKWKALAPVLDLDLLVVHTHAAALHLAQVCAGALSIERYTSTTSTTATIPGSGGGSLHHDAWTAARYRQRIALLRISYHAPAEATLLALALVLLAQL